MAATPPGRPGPLLSSWGTFATRPGARGLPESQGLGCCPTCPMPLAPKITDGITWTVLCPLPSLHLPASSRQPPSTSLSLGPCQSQLCTPHRRAPQRGDRQAFPGVILLVIRLSTGPASAGLWSPGTHSITTPFPSPMAVTPEGGVFAQGHRYGAPRRGRWRAPSSFWIKITTQVPSLSPNQHRPLLPSDSPL